MIKRLLLALIVSLILILPAYAGSPKNDPAPGKGTTSSARGPKEQVISIKTGPKDAKETKVGKDGKIEVPPSDAARSKTIYDPYATLPKPDEAGVPTEPPAAEAAKSPDDGSGPSQATEDQGGSASGSEILGSADLAKGVSGSGDTGLGSLSSNQAGQAGNTGGSDGGIPFSGAGFGFFGEVPITPPLQSSSSNQSSSSSSSSTTPVSIPTAELQALLDSKVSDDGVPGVILAVQTQAGTWIGASGKADLGNPDLQQDPQALTTDMQVRLSGVTKLFTAALIMKLVEENKISLDDTVEHWLWPDAVPSGDKITVAMLLNHTSGIHDHETTPEFLDLLYYEDPALPWDPFYNILPIIGFYPLDFDPGKEFKFSNSGYYILGMIAEASTGFTDTVENMIQTRFFGPLNLSRTALTPSGLQTAPFTRNYCWFGIPVWGQTMPVLTDTSGWDFSFDWTSGSGVSTAQDMLTWTKALFGGKLVNSESLAKMTTPQAPATDYGYGLQVVNPDPWFSEKMYGNGAENFGVLTRWLYYPDSGRTIFLALNRADQSDPPEVDAKQVADDLLSGVSTILSNAKAQ